jgi:octaprenyl-diphosphate synthase
LKVLNFPSTGSAGPMDEGGAMSQLMTSPGNAVPVPVDLYAPIKADLVEVERVLAQTLKSRYARITALVDHVSHYRGKRLRPALLLLTARACGRVASAHHVLGAVVEMIHTATLVHDDILDGATMRRHVATVNTAWGVPASILLGDYLFTHAFHLAATIGDADACRIIGEATNRTCEGELCQGLHRGNLELTEEEYLDVIEGKTADLISCCCRLGARYSGAAEAAVEGLTRYGRWLGLAFQIADDLLDLVGEERATGKSLGTDLEQKKLTLPLIRLLSQASPPAASRLRQLLAAPGNHKREALGPFLNESDAVAYTVQRARAFAAHARQELTCLPPSPCRTILEVLTERVVERTS